MCVEQSSNYHSYDIPVWPDSDSWRKSPAFVGLVFVCAHTHKHTRAVCRQAAGATDRQIGGKAMCVWRDGVWWGDGCVWEDGEGLEGYWVDKCPPFVFQIRGNLLAIVAPCMFTSQRAERGDFSATQPMTSRVSFYKSSSLGLSCSFILCLFLLSLRFVLDAAHSQPQPAIVW